MSIMTQTGGTRYVPVTLCLQVLFGGGFVQFGWLFFGFGMVFFWVFGAHSDALASWKFSQPLQKAKGTVLRCVDTGASEGGAHIYKIEYIFTPGGMAYRGTSYNTGDTMPKGEGVTVEYKADHPAFSRIQGMRSAEFGALAAIVAIFPLIGLMLVLIGLRRGVRAIGLLHSGIRATGTLVGMKTTMMSINDSPVYRMTFQFPVQYGGTGAAQLMTCNVRPGWREFYVRSRQSPAPPIDTSIPGQAPPPHVDPQEELLYDAGNPARSLFPWSQVGCTIHLDDNGNIQGVNPAIGLLATILPLLVIAGHGWYVWHFLLHK